MSKVSNILNKAKQHPFFISLAFIGAIVIGLGSFTDAISSLSKGVSCLPNKLGLAQPYQGQVVVKLTTIEKDWRKLRSVKKQRMTGNHHCESNCRGEPTRSNYIIDLSSSDYASKKRPEVQLRAPKLSCKSGPCGAWNHVWYTRTSENSQTAEASFDVWSHPTVWELSADLYSFETIKKHEAQEIIDVSSEKLFTINVKPNQEVEMVKAIMSDNRQISWRLGESDSSGVVALVSKSQNASSTEYAYQIVDQRCK